jgi:hypothetical protein
MTGKTIPIAEVLDGLAAALHAARRTPYGDRHG